MNESRLAAGPQLLSICSLVLVAAASDANAQDGRFEHGRASVYLGAFITDRDTETRLDSDSGAGTDVDWEEDLGLKSSMTVARLGGNFWIKPRQRFDFSVFDLSRSASATIDETIEFGDETFTINTVVDSTFDMSIAKADYTFAPVSRPRGYFGVTGGLYVASVKVSLNETSGLSAESEDLTAPLPVIGFRGEYELTERISLHGASQWFRIDTGDTSGRLVDFFVGADYRFGQRWDLGLGYNKVTMRIGAEESGGFSGHLDWGYDGWLLYLQANFGE